MTMNITREFLDWNLPALPAAVEALFRRYRRGDLLDMDRVIIVVPGSRAGRRLLDLLLARTEAESLRLLPPIVETVSVFPEQLYEPKHPFASDLTQLLAWVRALRECDESIRRQVVPATPDEDDFVGWMDMARMLWKLHRELAAESLHFEDVARAGSSIDGFEEQDRWFALRQIQLRYLHVLDGLGLWDMQTARRFAIDHHECHTDRDVILIGAVDINRAVRKMLDQIADRVTSFVFAPRRIADYFDEHGCLISQLWRNFNLPISTNQVRVAAGPAEQAEEVVRTLASFEGRYRPEEVIIGLPDDRILPALERRLNEVGVPSRWVVGKDLREMSPFKLLAAIDAFLDGERFRDFGSLVRHPDVYDWLLVRTENKDWLGQLDEYHNDHLQNRLGDWLGKPDESDLLQPVYSEIREALRPLRDQGVMALHEWAVRLADVMAHFYASREIDGATESGHYLLSALKSLRDGLLEFQSVPPELSPLVDVRQAIRLLQEQFGSGQISSPAESSVLELLGWLELPLDVAPALIVTSFNEGIIPSYHNADLFLPNSLRAELGLADNIRRYARDAYALSVLQASREHLTLIVSRRDAEHYPQSPSRLLFACDENTIVERVLRFFGEDEGGAGPSHIVSRRMTAEQTSLVVPKPIVGHGSIESLSVTAFRSYLECPYRFYLRHVLRLSSSTDDIDEMDGAAFGSLAHQVLDQFGKDPVCQSTDSAEIRNFLFDTLHQIANRQFGKDRMPAVDVQLLQLEARFEAFAEWQAEWASKGWIIEKTEVGYFPARPKIEVGDRALYLRGRIDRIDRNVDTNQWIVFDYKTSDTVSSPTKTHKRGGEWIDLQLPLYLRLVKSLGISGTIGLGYIVLPKDTAYVGDMIADWTARDLVAADEMAIDVATKILDGLFWPPRSWVQYDDFASICQSDVLGRVLAE